MSSGNAPEDFTTWARGISKGREICLSLCKKPKRAKWCILWLWIRENILVLCFIPISKTEQLQQLKGMQSSKLGIRKGVPFVTRRYTKGVPFLPKIVYRGVRGCSPLPREDLSPAMIATTGSFYLWWQAFHMQFLISAEDLSACDWHCNMLHVRKRNLWYLG